MNQRNNPGKRSYDIVIVGSGAGGGTVAQELSGLCGQGLRIAVLEKGPRLRDEEFTGRELEMAGALYEDGGGFLTADGTMTLAFGCVYGGSTAVYTGTSMLPRNASYGGGMCRVSLTPISSAARGSSWPRITRTCWRTASSTRTTGSLWTGAASWATTHGNFRSMSKAAEGRVFAIWVVPIRLNKAPIGYSCRAPSAVVSK